MPSIIHNLSKKPLKFLKPKFDQHYFQKHPTQCGRPILVGVYGVLNLKFIPKNCMTII